MGPQVVTQMIMTLLSVLWCPVPYEGWLTRSVLVLLLWARVSNGIPPALIEPRPQEGSSTWQGLPGGQDTSTGLGSVRDLFC